MRQKNTTAGFPVWFMPLLLGACLVACSGSRSPILGSGGSVALRPIVTAVNPLNNAVGVPLATTVTATFNEQMTQIAGAASFTLTCATPCVNPTGTVTLDATNTVATFTLTPPTMLVANTLYTATVTGATGLLSGLALAAPAVWQFTTGAPPTVTSTTPATTAPGPTAAPSNTTISALFSEDMAPATINSTSFTVTCAPSPCANAGTVSYDVAAHAAIYTPAAALTLGATYSATLTTAATDQAGNALQGNQAAAPAASNYVWTFIAAAPDITRPTVTVTLPATTSPGPTPAPSNTEITALFSKDMAANTITPASFTVTCAAPCVNPIGTVILETRTAVFAPGAPLTQGATYTATITTAVTDQVGNALAGNQAPAPATSNYVWTFIVGAATPVGNVTVTATNPTANQTAVCPSAGVNAQFTVPSGLRMDPSTVNATTFTVTGPAPTATPVAAATVVLDAATGTLATFTPQTPFTAGVTYTATVLGGATGVKDSAVPGNGMVNNFTWSFTAGPASGSCLAPVPLGAAAPFGDFGGTAGMTNQGILTLVNGDTGSIATGTSSITGFHDTAGDIYTETTLNKGAVNGTLFTCTVSTVGPTSAAVNPANCTVADNALADARKAYLALVALPPGANPGGNLAKLTLAPGVYTAPSGSFLILGGDLTLDGQGNANAVWVFQMATTLTVGGPGAQFPQSITLAGGAQAKNVFWQVGSAATINAGGGGTMVGTIISQAGATFSTAGNVAVVTLNGRALSLGASVTVVNTVINVPAP